MRILFLDPLFTILLDMLLWVFFHLSIAWLTSRINTSFFSTSKGIYRLYGWEQSFYEKRLFIKSWKKFLPDGGSLFKDGFAKKNLKDNSFLYMERFIVETRRGEFSHWLQILPAPLFFLWNEPWVGGVMIIYALAFNLPLIMTQRYNRIRLQRVIQRSKSPKEETK